VLDPIADCGDPVTACQGIRKSVTCEADGILDLRLPCPPVIDNLVFFGVLKAGGVFVSRLSLDDFLFHLRAAGWVLYGVSSKRTGGPWRHRSGGYGPIPSADVALYPNFHVVCHRGQDSPRTLAFGTGDTLPYHHVAGLRPPQTVPFRTPHNYVFQTAFVLYRIILWLILAHAVFSRGAAFRSLYLYLR
jgi:hypothetical protein